MFNLTGKMGSSIKMGSDIALSMLRSLPRVNLGNLPKVTYKVS